MPPSPISSKSASIFVEVVRLLVVLLATATGYTAGGGSISTATASGDGRSAVIGAVLGALTGYVVGGVFGRVINNSIARADRRLASVPTYSLLAGSIGGVACAGTAAVIAIPAPILIPNNLGWVVYVLAVWIGAYFGYWIASSKSEEVLAAAGLSTRPLARSSSYSHNLGSEVTLLDASAVIDGRLLSLAQAGLVSGTLLVPTFELDEIRAIAEASDAARRKRGRRGLDVLEALRRVPGTDVQVVDDAVLEHTDRGAKLVSLAKRLRVGIITVDSPLQQAAELQDIACLNLDQLNELLRATHVPGEVLEVTLSKVGKEPGQGVGYLQDGSMVVVAGGSDLLGEQVNVEVDNVKQTSVGVMIFGRATESDSVA